MASSTDYTQAYQKAERAYMQGSYEDAAGIIDQLAAEYPTDPSVLLLRGHIYCYGLHRYNEAREQYRAVLSVTADPEFVDFANNGLAYAEEQASAIAYDDDGTSGIDTNATLVDRSPADVVFDDGYSKAPEFFEDEDLTDFNLDAADIDLDLSADMSEDLNFEDSPFEIPEVEAEVAAAEPASNVSEGLDFSEELDFDDHPFDDGPFDLPGVEAAGGGSTETASADDLSEGLDFSEALDFDDQSFDDGSFDVSGVEAAAAETTEMGSAERPV
jgi:twitching motility protein PilJ